MIISTDTFKKAGNKKESLLISNFNKLTATEAIMLRDKIAACINNDYDEVYVNTKDVEETDLSGINEIIHSHFKLQQAARQLVLVYRKNSVVEKWVKVTGLHRFISTAIIPSL